MTDRLKKRVDRWAAGWLLRRMDRWATQPTKTDDDLAFEIGLWRLYGDPDFALVLSELRTARNV